MSLESLQQDPDFQKSAMTPAPGSDHFLPSRIAELAENILGPERGNEVSKDSHSALRRERA